MPNFALNGVLPPGHPEREDNKARFLEGNHPEVPHVVYHGTNADIQAFRPSHRGFISLATKPEFASIYAEDYWDGESPSVMPVHVSAKNPFNFEDPEHLAAIKTKLGNLVRYNPNVMDEIAAGEWGTIESHPVQQAIKSLGHDSFFMHEMDPETGDKYKNIGVFSPTQIKSAIGNQGTFDPNNPDITKATGGEVDDRYFSPVPGVEAYHEDPAFKEWFGNSATHRDGVPVTYYTGTSKDTDFNKFNVGRHGAWFTADPAEASQYAVENDSMGYRYEGGRYVRTNTASRVIPAHLKIENPYTGPIPPEFFKDNYKAAQSQFFDILRAKGHDGWIPADRGGKLAVVLKAPHQIKTVNNRTWDAKNPRMDKATGGEVEDEGITAYHGSPHDFDEFDLSKIGTGEGAQAFGHGLYFAENEGVAKGYRDTLSRSAQHINLIDSATGETLSEQTPGYDHLKRFFGHFGFEPSDEDRRFITSSLRRHADTIEKDRIPEIEQNIAQYPEDGASKERLRELTQSIAAYRGAADLVGKVAARPGGRMYEVRIDANPDHFLDWDKPLSEQPEIVQHLARTANLDHLAPGNKTRRMIEMWREGALPNAASEPTGHVLHNALTDYGQDTRRNAAMTDVYRAAGIPGIKYFDRGSRGTTEGTRNYVVFDDKLVNVKRKYADGGVVKED